MGKVSLEDLVDEYRRVWSPGTPSFEAATTVTRRRAAQLSDGTRGKLVLEGARTLPAESRYGLSPGVRLFRGWSVAGHGDWKDLTDEERIALMSAGLVAIERVRSSPKAWRRVGALTAEERRHLAYVGHLGDDGMVLALTGWIPGFVAAPIAGLVAALLASNPWLFPIVALGGGILGIAAPYVLVLLLAAVEDRWLAFGAHWSTAEGVAILAVGPAVAVLVALVTLCSTS